MLGCPLTALGVAAAVTAVDGAVDPSLLERIDRLEHRLEAVEARRADWLTLRRAEALRDLIGGVLLDSEARVSLRSDAVLAGHDDDFFIESADGRFRLEVGGQLQVRHTFNHKDDEDGDDDRSEFEVRRLKIDVNGHAVDPAWTYKVSLTSVAGAVSLQTGAVRRRLGRGWSVRAGQFKLAMQREQSVSSRRQLLVERSLVGRSFRLGYVQGVELEHEARTCRYWITYSDGERSASTAAFDRTAELALTGRVELRVGGRWRQFADFPSWTSEDAALLLGAGIHFQEDDGSAADLLRWTVDVSGETGGLTVFAAFVGEQRRRSSGQLDSRWGAVAQLGGFVGEDLEVFARYETGDAAGDAPTLGVLTAGVNRYFAKHELKLTIDLGIGLNGVDGFWSSARAGWRTDDPGARGQVVLRTQIQLLF